MACFTQKSVKLKQYKAGETTETVKKAWCFTQGQASCSLPGM